MRNTFFTTFITITLLLSTSAWCNDDSFYKTREKGWFWHETEPEEDEEQELDTVVSNQPVVSEQSEQPEEMIEINAEWLKENIPVLQMKAINNPSPENLGAFYSAQRVMLDMSSNFAAKTQDYFRKEGNFLSEDHRRPTESFMLNKFKLETHKQTKPVLQKVSSYGGLWFFYSSQCPYCLKQLPVMRSLEISGMDVLYVSLDGGIIPGIPEDKVVYDYNGKVAQDFNIQVTPTTYLVSKDAQHFKLLNQGSVSLPKMQLSIFQNAYAMDWINELEYQSVKAIKGTNTLANGNIAVKASEIDDPAVLQRLLEQKIDLSSSPIGTPFKGIKR
ncbi:conjugal transfer protein TraF [Shewanella aestuarii]|uniref:Conjugal transfer protein TraF n=1 Tax=Shewanella aestuarii TaxID=1028752 RepID=A0A6G9QRJ3_9GAMM|nr:conjugal transfer protein TraF [Shewanella aestuarii]QIR16429.1 conjugal transfer protein TraF [Shewanella aestuarii]